MISIILLHKTTGNYFQLHLVSLILKCDTKLVEWHNIELFDAIVLKVLMTILIKNEKSLHFGENDNIN